MTDTPTTTTLTRTPSTVAADVEKLLAELTAKKSVQTVAQTALDAAKADVAGTTTALTILQQEWETVVSAVKNDISAIITTTGAVEEIAKTVEQFI